MTSLAIVENAPAALVAEAKAIVATHCALCGRALKDALSVAMGIGPDCRDRVGLDDRNVDVDSLKRINEAISQLAILRHTGGLTSSAILQAYEVIRAEGFIYVANGIADRLASIHIVEGSTRDRHNAHTDTLAISSPYHDAFAPMLKSACPGARWDKARKVWTIDARQRGALWGVLKRCYPGALGMGPKGAFAI